MQQLQQQRLNGKYSSTPQLANGQMGHNQASQQQQHNSPGPHQRRSLQTSMPAYTSSSAGGGVKRGGVGGGGIPAPGFSSRIPQQKWSLIVIKGLVIDLITVCFYKSIKHLGWHAEKGPTNVRRKACWQDALYVFCLILRRDDLSFTTYVKYVA